MTGNKLVCPHCGHDGTLGTSKPPLGSYGFNYLAEGIVCREVCGTDSSGLLTLSGDFRCEGSPAASARIECRSCWRTFPVPEGVGLADVPESSGQPMDAGESHASAPVSAEGAAEAIGRNLIAILRASVEESARLSGAQIVKVEADVAGLAQAVEGMQPVAAGLAVLREGAAAAAEAQEQGRRIAMEQGQALASVADELSRHQAEAGAREETALRRFEALEADLAAVRETVAKLSASFTAVEGNLQLGRVRLDAQADVIRALHAAAQEQITRREELRAAVQKLESLAAGLDDVIPLPNEL